MAEVNEAKREKSQVEDLSLIHIGVEPLNTVK